MFKSSRPGHPGRPSPRRLRAAGAILAVLTLAGPVRAQTSPDATSFTPAQRAEIVQVVRDALKTDPSILGDAITALRASAQQTEANATASAIRANRLPLSGQAGDAILGNPNGNVTVVEFYDPRCPYCRHEIPDLDALLASDHKVRLVEKLIPILGPNSLLDAQAIQAAGLQGKYAALQRVLMGDSGAPGLDRIKTLAGGVGLDVDRLLRDMNGPAVKAVLEANLALAHTLHLTGTPSFVIGDQAIEGAAGPADLRSAIAAVRNG